MAWQRRAELIATNLLRHCSTEMHVHARLGSLRRIGDEANRQHNQQKKRGQAHAKTLPHAGITRVRQALKLVMHIAKRSHLICRLACALLPTF
jgi:hypothetical protein